MSDHGLQYLECGSGTPLALLHGFPLDGRMWEGQAKGLSDVARVIVPDFRGFGKSIGNQAFTIQTMADDLHALLEKLGALPAVIGGLSMGGYVALAFARKYPAALRGLILADTQAGADSAEARKRRDATIKLVKIRGTAAAVENVLPRLLAPDTPMDVVQRVRQIMMECSAQTIAMATAAMRDREDYTELLSRIRTAALVLVGEKDVVTPVETARAMQQKIAGAELRIIAGAGHLSPIERPAQVTAAIREFLRRV